MDTTGVQWKRLVIEGVVIVVSILLAISIDAWWDERQEEQQARDQAARVVSELQANIAILERHISDLDKTTAVAREMLSKIKPDPEPLTRDDIGLMFGDLYASGTLMLPDSATVNFLSSGQLTDGAWAKIRYDLSKILGESQVSQRRSLELRAMRAPMLEVAGRHVPLLESSIKHPVMEGYSPSEFPYDPTALLADMAFENQMAIFAIRMEINRLGHQELLERYRQILIEIEEARAE